jgi:hypothetical protein
MLKKSVRIFLPDPHDSEENSPRIWLSSGICPASDSEFDRIRYRDNAFLPQEPWRQPTDEELSLLVPRQEDLGQLNRWDLGSDLGVVRIPPECLLPLDKLNLHSIESGTDRSIISDEEIAISEVRDRILGYCQGSTATEILGINIAAPDLTTITIDRQLDVEQQTYAGMHLDSWDKLPLKHRHKSRNRLCINLGKEDRFFLFIDLTLMDIFRALGLSETKDIYKYYRGLQLGEAFMYQYPNCPVVKLRVAPGEAYIAPTENIIHDATNRSTRHPDLTLTFLGYFGVLTIRSS